MSQQQLRRRKHAGQRGANDEEGATGEDGAALRESLLTRSASGDEDGGGDPGTPTTATAGPLILRPGPFSVVAFLSAVVDRWLSLVWSLVRGGGGGNRAHPNNNNRDPLAAPAPPPSSSTVAGARRVVVTSAAAAASASSSSAASPGVLHLREALAEPYLADDLEHQDALLELWSLAFGPDGPEPPAERGAAAGGDGCARCGAALRSARWQEMGWQGLDPATDFRGAGRFGLENLLSLGRRRPLLFCALLRKERGARSAWEYPFCVAGLNLTFALGDVLEVVAGAGGQQQQGAGQGAAAKGAAQRGANNATSSTTTTNGGGPRTAAGRAFASMVARAEAQGAEEPAADSAAAAAATPAAAQQSATAAAAAAAERAFDEVYAAAFALLDAVWLERGAGYMEFGAVMADTRRRLASALARCAGEEEGAGAKKGGAVARAWAAVAGAGGVANGSARRRNGGGGTPGQLSAGAAGGAVAPGAVIIARDIARAAGLHDEVLAML